MLHVHFDCLCFPQPPLLSLIHVHLFIAVGTLKLLTNPALLTNLVIYFRTVLAIRADETATHHVAASERIWHYVEIFLALRRLLKPYSRLANSAARTVIAANVAHTVVKEIILTD